MKWKTMGNRGMTGKMSNDKTMIQMQMKFFRDISFKLNLFFDECTEKQFTFFIKEKIHYFYPNKKSLQHRTIQDSLLKMEKKLDVLLDLINQQKKK